MAVPALHKRHCLPHCCVYTYTHNTHTQVFPRTFRLHRLYASVPGRPRFRGEGLALPLPLEPDGRLARHVSSMPLYRTQLQTIGLCILGLSKAAAVDFESIVSNLKSEDQPGALTKFLHAVEWRDMEDKLNPPDLCPTFRSQRRVCILRHRKHLVHTWCRRETTPSSCWVLASSTHW